MATPKVDAIVTMPPYAPYLEEVLAHGVVSGIRLNTVMPLKETHIEALARLDGAARAQGKRFYVDLKGRQLRVKTFGVPPFTEIELSHNISVDTPTTAYFSGGRQQATVVGVNGNKLIMLDGPRKVVGPGEAINIPDPSLRIEGYLTESDKMYIAAAKEVGAHQYMLSFVESDADIDALRELDPKAGVISKIESRSGLEYTRGPRKESRLMAARGDLYLEVAKPHLISGALDDIIRADPRAIVASRIFDSMVESPMPSCADIGDVENLMRTGYRTFMFGDEICQQRDSVISGLNLLEAMAKEYVRRGD
jgi:pyruvate kinase